MKKVFFLLGTLNNDDVNWIACKGRKEIIQPGTILIREGRPIDTLYIVLSGSLSVQVTSLGNREIARISNGEVVGEISLIDSRPPLATVKAAERSEVLAIPRVQLALKLQQDMGFAARFYQAIALSLADRMRGTIRRLGYEVEAAIADKDKDEPNPSVVENLVLAEAKYNWLTKAI